MIRQLRNRFIRIATLSVAAVLTGILNAANYLSTDADLRSTLALICENEGTIPAAVPSGSDDGSASAAERPGHTPADPARPGRDGPFTLETPYSTRYFVLRYTDDGTLSLADLTKIASVSETDTAAYLTAAVDHGAGYGSFGDYRFLVTHTGDNRNMAIFLNRYQELRAVRNVLLWSLLADAGCIV